MGTTLLNVKEADTQQIDVMNFIAHPEYSPISLQNDIALLSLYNKIPASSSSVQPIALNNVAVNVNTPCMISGWGKQYNDAVGLHFL